MVRIGRLNSCRKRLHRNRHLRLRRFMGPHDFFMRDANARRSADAARRAARHGAERPGRGVVLVLPDPSATEAFRNHRCRQPRYPREFSRGPEVLRPRLAAGLPFSAIGRLAAAQVPEHRTGAGTVICAVTRNPGLNHGPSHSAK